LRIGSQLRAFQRAIDEVHTLPLTPPNGGLKANLSFKNKFPYISITDESSNFKFGMPLSFAKTNYHIPPEEKVGVALGYWSSPDLGIPFNISATAEASYIKFGVHLGFTKGHHKSTPRGKIGRRP